ncbi:MAG: aminomethyltransferase family protein [Pseudomonadota bacterium]
MFVGTAAIKRDMAWLARWSEGFDVRLRDVTGDWAVLGLMGPAAPRVARALGGDPLLDLGYFRHGPARLAGCEVRGARLSYVGEAGWEITCRAGDAPALYAAMTGAGARPAGLYAQTSMRIEKGFCAMGHELDGDLSPIETGLEFATRATGGFTGFEALEERRAKGAVNRLVSLSFEDDAAVPIGHEPICSGARILGQTTSCAYGYRVGRPVALGLTREPLADGAAVEVDIAGQRFAARVARGPLFDPDGSRMKP